MPFRELYEHQDWYKFALSFDDDGNPVKGEISEVYKRTAYEYLTVTFQDNSVSRVVGEHRYYVPEGRYIAIKHLRYKFIMDETNDPIRVKSLTVVKVPTGIDVYNARIMDYQNYCADGKRVHNLKPVNNPPE